MIGNRHRDSAARTSRIAACQLYWSLLDADVTGADHRRSPNASTQRRLMYLLEEDVPVPAESLHAVFASLGSKRLLACAIHRDVLESLRDEGLNYVVPAELPPVLALDAPVNPMDLNLLHGEFRSHTITRRIRRNALLAGLSILAAGLLMFMGAERRSATSKAEILATNRATQALLDEVLPEPRGDSRPAALRLTQELRLLRQAVGVNGSDQSIGTAMNAAVELAELMRHWPIDAEIRTERLMISPAMIEIRGEAADLEAWANLKAALTDLDGWKGHQDVDTAVARHPAARSFTLTLTPQTAGSSPGATP